MILDPRTIGFVDSPEAEAIIGPRVTISGWALDPAGIRGVEVRLGELRFTARTGIARLDVARVKPGYPNGENGGFELDADFSPYPAPPELLRRKIEVVAIAADGRETLLGTRSLIEPGALLRWGPAEPARSAFYLLPALSGVAQNGTFDLEARYGPYLSSTTRIGMRVPILYLRTTKGPQEDFVFDPAFDLARTSGGRAVADDSLDGVMAASIARQLPVLLTLNGGIWGDASSTAPEWDVNDWLEMDDSNCQWNEKDEVMPDDHLKHLPGSFDAPELARSLTFNVYARKVRHYKRRNLQQAARIIVEFAHEHAGLFVGVSVDPDTYLNPFFDETQWYDYNPGTLRQFRHWLAGSGPYAGKPEPDVPDLSAYSRSVPLDLPAVRGIAGRTFRSWDEVDPPRSFSRDAARPFWRDPWVREWELFRRHLVALHYDELANWLIEAGIPGDRIWSAQGFMAPTPEVMPLALRLDSPVKDYDSGGVTVEGSKPAAGHLGAIVYGAAASNQIPMEDGGTLFDAFAAVDPGFAVVELNTADLRNPDVLPTYADGYRAFRDLWNAGARFVSPMAWNGSNGAYAGQPGYVTRTAWRNTPLEEAACDCLLARAGLALESFLWTFGGPRHAESDGWTAEAGTISPGNGYLTLTPDGGGRVALLSPIALPARIDAVRALVLGMPASSDLREIGIFARSAFDPEWRQIARAVPPDWNETPAGILVDRDPAAAVARIAQLRIELALGTSTRKLLCVAALLSR